MTEYSHTPFGHAGEKMLHLIMCPKSDVVKDSPFFEKEADTIKRELEREDTSIPEVISYETMFGFKHNIQSVRVAVVLEDSYRGRKGENIGLNLTNYTLWGMMNHSKRLYEEKEEYPNFQNQFTEHISINGTKIEAWSFEGYVVERADDIAQWHHDLEDAVREHRGRFPVF